MTAKQNSSFFVPYVPLNWQNITLYVHALLRMMDTNYPSVFDFAAPNIGDLVDGEHEHPQISDR